MHALRKKALVAAVTFLLTVSISACGTILYPERLRKPRSDKIDASTLILDCLWFFPFVIPGMIAVFVDLYDGTLHYSRSDLSAEDRGPVIIVLLP